MRASAVVMLDTPCYEIVRRVLATHSIRQFPLHFPSLASTCAIMFQLDCSIRVAVTPFLGAFLSNSCSSIHLLKKGKGKGVLVGKPEGKRPLGGPRRRWEDNIKMDLQEVGGVVGTGWSWLRIGTGGGHFGFQK